MLASRFPKTTMARDADVLNDGYMLTFVILGLGPFSVQSVINNNPLDQDE